MLPEFPEELWYIWAWHGEIFTGSELTYQEVRAWAELMRIEVTPDEVSVLLMIDRTFWQVHNEGK